MKYTVLLTGVLIGLGIGILSVLIGSGGVQALTGHSTFDSLTARNPQVFDGIILASVAMICLVLMRVSNPKKGRKMTSDRKQ